MTIHSTAVKLIPEPDFLVWGTTFGILKSMFYLIKSGAKQSGLEVEVNNLEGAIRHFENSDIVDASDAVSPERLPEIKSGLLDLSSQVMQLYIMMNGSYKLIRNHGSMVC